MQFALDALLDINPKPRLALLTDNEVSTLAAN